MKKISGVLCLFFVLSKYSTSQIAVGSWRYHLPYKTVISLTEGDQIIYCATTYSIFTYDKNEREIDYYNKVTGLTDIGITKVKFNERTHTVYVGYENGNIDLIKNGKVTNINDIKNKNIYGSKFIHNFLFIDDLAYISTGFGVLLFDVDKLEFKDMYSINKDNIIDVNDLAFDGTNFYAGTKSGVYTASKSDLDKNPQLDWVRIDSIPKTGYYNHIINFNGKIVANKFHHDKADTLFILENGVWTKKDLYYDNNNSFFVRGPELIIGHDYDVTVNKADLTPNYNIYTYHSNVTTNANDAYMDEHGVIWIADKNSGLGNSVSEYFLPNGPSNNLNYRITSIGDKIYVAGGGRVNTTGNDYYENAQFHCFENEAWKTIDGGTAPDLSALQLHDVLKIIGHPDDENEIYLACLPEGLLKMNNHKVDVLYNDKNSSLLDENPNNTFSFVGTPSAAFDQKKNLWVTNTRSNYSLHVRTPAGDWQAFAVPPLAGTFFIEDIMVTRNGNKWIQVLDGQYKGIVVFSENGTISNTNDDKFTYLTQGEGYGNLPSDKVFSFAEDLIGNVWVGTTEGLVVFYSPDDIINKKIDAQKILVEKGGYVANLLEGQNITSICVDGANRKWIGTESDGVYLLSEDGTKEIYHFKAENSPLLSNRINSIAILPKTGEVFFGTEDGVLSFKSDATSAELSYDFAYVYPNPVKNNYAGPISINGLIKNSQVKITDIAGNIVFETTSKGGLATWYGKDFQGKRVSTGIYLVYCYAPDGASRFAGKIIFIN